MNSRSRRPAVSLKVLILSIFAGFILGLTVAVPSFVSSAQIKAGETLTPDHVTPAVPSPDLKGMDEAVQHQLREAQSRLVAVQQNPGNNHHELAEAWGLLGQLYQAYGLNPAASTCYLSARS